MAPNPGDPRVMNLAAYEAAVADLVSRTGCDPAKAEQLVRAQLPHLAPPPHPGEAQLRANVLEKEEQRECVKIYRAHGCVVYSTSQARASKVSAGIPDLLVFAPRVGVFFVHEIKRSAGGVPSSAQAEFQSLCFGCGVRYVIGDRAAAWDTLRKIGVIQP
jgi:hypothetical protein